MKIDWNTLEKKSEQLRLRLGINGKIKIERVWEEAHLGIPYIMVQYLDYNRRCRDEANLTDVVAWINWEEKFVDNMIFLKLKVQELQSNSNKTENKICNDLYSRKTDLVDDEGEQSINSLALINSLDDDIKQALKYKGLKIIEATRNELGGVLYKIESKQGKSAWYNIVEIKEDIL